MANRESRLDSHAIDFSLVRKHIVKRLAADGVICPEDRAVIEAFDQELAELHDTAARHRFAAYIEKGGDPGTYMDHLTCPIGFRVVSLEDHRHGRTVIPFPGRTDDAG